MNKARRYALIYVPGLQIGLRDQSVDMVSRRIAIALNYRQSEVDYVIEEPRDEKFGVDDHIVRSRTIRRPKRVGKEAWRLDIYELDYQDFLQQTTDSNKPVSQIRLILGALWFSMIKVFSLVFKKGKSTLEKLRMGFGAIALALLAAYLFLIIPTFVGTLHQYFHTYLGLPDTHIIARVLHWLEVRTEALHTIYVGTLTVGLFSNKNLQNRTRRLTRELAQVIHYFGKRSDNFRSSQHLVALLKHLKAKGSRYNRIDILAYSFGNIIAMDALFPSDSDPSDIIGKVDTFVSIGNPYDMVRTFWPRYFLGRNTLPNAPRRWINIYSPRDLFASNFRNDRKEIKVDRNTLIGAGISTNKSVPEPENLVFPAAHSLKDEKVWAIPFKVRVDTHRKYWSGAYHDNNKCFERVAKILYD